MKHNCGVSNTDLIERVYSQEKDEYRSEFQRDRDRIVHSNAFRRLEYKTQVFVNSLGDNYRTRLTHSIEVAQLARTVARATHLNEDLIETLSLAHDMGHPAFGHAGERVLNQLLKDEGGFDHNKQSLKIVTELEIRYPTYEGLNLTQAVLLGLQKHDEKPNGLYHTFEAHIMDICDEIAYNNHDLDDGLDSGFLNLDILNEVEIWKQTFSQIKNKFKDANEKVLIRYTISQIIHTMIMNLIENVFRNIQENNLKSLADVLHCSTKFHFFTKDLSKQIIELKEFLFANLYRHPEVIKMNARAEEIVERIFNFIYKNIDVLPKEYQNRIETYGKKITIADFISGMTDRYANQWNKNILGL